MNKKWYGSIDNRLLERGKMPDPQIGMGATELCYSDRNPYEIVEIKDARHIAARPLRWTRIDHNGLSESQEYEYSSDESAPTIRLFLTKQGRWRERYPDGRLSCDSFALGFAARYCDPTF